MLVDFIINRMQQKRSFRCFLVCSTLLISLLLVSLAIGTYVFVKDILNKQEKMNKYASMTNFGDIQCAEICSSPYFYPAVNSNVCCANNQDNCLSKSDCVGQLMQNNQKSQQKDEIIIFCMYFCIFILAAISFLIYRKYKSTNSSLQTQANEIGDYYAINSNQSFQESNDISTRKATKVYQSFTYNDNQNSCPICLEIFNGAKAVRLNCGHLFHSSCIRNWSIISETCPFCRRSSC